MSSASPGHNASELTAVSGGVANETTVSGGMTVTKFGFEILSHAASK